MGIKNQSDSNLLKLCIINTINWEADCRATREVIHRATQISTSSSHLIQTNK